MCTTATGWWASRLWMQITRRVPASAWCRWAGWAGGAGGSAMPCHAMPLHARCAGQVVPATRVPPLHLPLL